jgi:hypothetical protein
MTDHGHHRNIPTDRIRDDIPGTTAGTGDAVHGAAKESRDA